MTDIIPPLERVPIEPLPPLSERARIHAAAMTAISLLQLGDESIQMHEEDENIARDIFSEGRTPTKTELQMPGVVMKLDALLTEYDYSIIEDANRLRNYVVNRLIEESTDKKNGMKALELLGKLTEVGLFTERKEIMVTHQSTELLEDKLRESLTILLNPEDVQVVHEPQKKPSREAEENALIDAIDLDDVFE